MRIERFETTSKDGTRLFVREWLPEGSSWKAIVVLIHGIGEHGEYYGEVASALTQRGIALFAYDQRGHGRSEGKRGHNLRKLALVEDAEHMLQLARRRHPGLACFLYGHSMGGLVALSCALRSRPNIQGLILTSPWLRLAFQPSLIKLWAGRIIAKLWPSCSFRTGLKHADLYSGAQPNDDPLAHDRISAGMYEELNKEGQWALAHGAELSIPLLLLHGTSDRITSYAASSELASSLDGRCCFHAWPDGNHELHNDPDQEQVISVITDWIGEMTHNEHSKFSN